jgi:hypothetical protein
MGFLKSIGAVLAGFMAIVVLSLAADVGVYTAWGVPPFSRPLTDSLFLLAVGYRAAFGVVSGWVAARLAPTAPIRHAVALGAFGLILGTLGALATWNEPGLGPRWYSVAVAAISLPCAWLGGRLQTPR